MTTYIWNVKDLYTKTEGQLQDYVVFANYEVTGTDGTYTASLPSTCQFEVTQGSTFVPYEDLTEELVIEWIQQTLGVNGVTSITACIDGQIESQKNPPVTPQNTPLPW
jgi:hypothetical protein